MLLWPVSSEWPSHKGLLVVAYYGDLSSGKQYEFHSKIADDRVAGVHSAMPSVQNKNTLLQFSEYNYLFGISNLAVPESSNWQSQLSPRSSSVCSECLPFARSGINYPDFFFWKRSSGFRFRQSHCTVSHFQ